MTPSSESTSLCMRNDVTMVDECKQKTTTSSTYVKKNFLMNSFPDGLKAWMDLYRQCVCRGSYLKCAVSMFKAKYDNWIGGSLPCAELPMGCAPTMHIFSVMTSQQSGSPASGEGNSQIMHGSITDAYMHCQKVELSEWGNLIVIAIMYISGDIALHFVLILLISSDFANGLAPSATVIIKVAMIFSNRYENLKCIFTHQMMLIKLKI